MTHLAKTALLGYSSRLFGLTSDIAKWAEVKKLESDLPRFHSREGSTCTTRGSLKIQRFQLVVDFAKGGREREDGGALLMALGQIRMSVSVSDSIEICAGPR